MISLVNLSKQFGDKILYRDVSIAFNTTHRTGLIGSNGAGKSVLLRIIAGIDHSDAGHVAIAGNLRLGYLPQESDVPESVSAIDFVLEPFRHLLDAHENHDGEDLDKMAKLLDEMHVADVYSLPSRAASVLSGLGIGEDRSREPMSILSGGFRMRVVLARLLLSAPDFLLLDEPTNHLDMDSLIWLERFLARFDGGMMIVSHDRDFLDRMTDHTAELSAGGIDIGVGSVSAFLEAKAEQREAEAKRTKTLQNQIDKTEAFIDRFKAKATKASQARSRMKLLERLNEELPDTATVSTQSLNFRFPPAPPCGSIPLKVENATAGYGDNTIFSKLDLTVTRGQKIAVIGPNGAGKTTLLKLLAGALEPAAGAVTIGHNAKLRYYAQHRLDQLDPRRTLYETISSIVGLVERSVVQGILGAFLFSGDEVNKTVGVCSGGEKSRLSLATLLADPGNVLLLDEPTNHLDIDAIEKLATALAAYDGTVIFVSHDEYLIDIVADRIIEVRKGSLRDFPGNLTDYRWYIENGIGVDVPSDADTAAKRQQADANIDKQLRQKRREEKKQLERVIQKIEKRLEETEQAIDRCETVLHDPANVNDYQRLSEADAELKRLKIEADKIMEEWTEASEKLAGISE